jgi:hypothetical protein
MKSSRFCHLQRALNTIYCTDPHAVTTQCVDRSKASSRICVANNKGNSDFSCRCFIHLITTSTHNSLHLSHTLLVMWHSIQWTLTLLYLSCTFSQATVYIYIYTVHHLKHMAALLLPMCPIHGKVVYWPVAQADPLYHLQT